MTLTESFQTLAVTLDFENGTATGYDREGNVLGVVNFTPPSISGLTSNLDWLSSVSSSVNWWMSKREGCTLLMDNFTVYEGEYVPKPVVLPEG